MEGLPPPPDVGFFGRDETLLALDRAFDTQHIVLLHAYAGSGKTATAAEFARWYAQTGGNQRIPSGAAGAVEGPVFFTSFERYLPLPRVLDVVGRAFEPLLEGNDIHWLALDDRQRAAVALQIFRQIPLLWIWDNVEGVAGFPAGTASAWQPEEQQALKAFLAAAAGAGAKFLLTSRRDEQGWLGDLPRRVTLPPMPMQERVQLARGLAERQGKRMADVADWRPLLEYTAGNPLTITVVVGQAFRDNLRTGKEIAAYVGRLRAGGAAFADEESEGRARSLGASLSYGFRSAFSAAERRILALLHLFQGFVQVGALQAMGDPRIGNLPELANLQPATLTALLDRAAEIGLLAAHGGGYYAIHPALPWYFKALFEEAYATATPGPSPAPGATGGAGVRATRAFVEAMGEVGNYYWKEYESGNRDVIGALAREEANLLHARALARANGWQRRVISTMQGLRQLYSHTGRRGEWAGLVAEIVPDFVDPATDGPLPGREEQWGLVTEYRVHLVEEARRWPEAERLQRVCVDWDRRRAAAALAAAPSALDAAGHNAIRTLAVSLHELGEIQRERDTRDCVPSYEEAAELLRRIGDRTAEASAAFNLGHAYKDIPALRDLAEAERWYRCSLELRDPRDRKGRGGCLAQLGLVAYERFKDARSAGQPADQLLQHLNGAVGYYHQALDLLPPDAVDDLAVTHNQLGIIYRNAGDLDRALPHYREGIRYDESAGNLYGAAQTRFNVALGLAKSSRFDDALVYAQAALRGYATYGDRAAAEMQETQGLIAVIEAARRGK